MITTGFDEKYTHRYKSSQSSPSLGAVDDRYTYICVGTVFGHIPTYSYNYTMIGTHWRARIFI